MHQQSTKSDIEQLTQALNQLSTDFPALISTSVFSTSLFRSRSEYMVDYLQEIRENLGKLDQLVDTNPQYQWLYEHCETQIMAFVQVAMRNQKQVKQAAAPKGSSASSTLFSRQQYLQQELVKHHDYERRLKDNLYKAQEAAQASGDHNSVLVCQQRLIRCQHAIENIERQLER